MQKLDRTSTPETSHTTSNPNGDGLGLEGFRIDFQFSGKKGFSGALQQKYLNGYGSSKLRFLPPNLTQAQNLQVRALKTLTLKTKP